MEQAMPLEITPLTDAALTLALNNAAVPDAGELSHDKARWLTDHCMLPGLATMDDQVAGMVVVLSDNCGYESDFYRWFTDRRTNFLYIDRMSSRHGRVGAARLWGCITPSSGSPVTKAWQSYLTSIPNRRRRHPYSCIALWDLRTADAVPRASPRSS